MVGVPDGVEGAIDGRPAPARAPRRPGSFAGSFGAGIQRPRGFPGSFGEKLSGSFLCRSAWGKACPTVMIITQ
jgi:hypothetical protein